MMTRRLLVFLAVVGLISACKPSATTLPPTSAVPMQWSIPSDQYAFVERWIEISQGSSMFIDFPTYHFDPNTGALAPDIVPPGRWFPLEDFTQLKVAYGRGTSRTGQAGTGANSRVFAVTELPFTEPPKEDADVAVTIEGIDAYGVAYLLRGDQSIVLQPGEEWTWEGKSTIDWSGNRLEMVVKERISNFGLLDKAGIQLIKDAQPTN